jgi:hypothetical protein
MLGGVMGFDLLFEKKQKVMSFLLAQMKELKKTSTPSKASPYIGRMQTENCRNRQLSVGFGKPGHGLGFFFLFADMNRKSDQYKLLKSSFTLREKRISYYVLF